MDDAGLSTPIEQGIETVKERGQVTNGVGSGYVGAGAENIFPVASVAGIWRDSS